METDKDYIYNWIRSYFFNWVSFLNKYSVNEMKEQISFIYKGKTYYPFNCEYSFTLEQEAINKNYIQSKYL